MFPQSFFYLFFYLRWKKKDQWAPSIERSELRSHSAHSELQLWKDSVKNQDRFGDAPFQLYFIYFPINILTLLGWLYFLFLLLHLRDLNWQVQMMCKTTTSGQIISLSSYHASQNQTSLHTFLRFIFWLWWRGNRTAHLVPLTRLHCTDFWLTAIAVECVVIFLCWAIIPTHHKDKCTDVFFYWGYSS